MKTQPAVFKRVMEKAAEDLLSLSNEHPVTQNLLVEKIDIVVHYKGTISKILCSPRIFCDACFEAVVVEPSRKTVWAFLLEESS